MQYDASRALSCADCHTQGNEIGAFFVTIGAFLVTIGAFCVTIGAFLVTIGCIFWDKLGTIFKPGALLVVR